MKQNIFVIFLISFILGWIVTEVYHILYTNKRLNEIEKRMKQKIKNFLNDTKDD